MVQVARTETMVTNAQRQQQQQRRRRGASNFNGALVLPAGRPVDPLGPNWAAKSTKRNPRPGGPRERAAADKFRAAPARRIESGRRALRRTRPAGTPQAN
jgi:hypothetical protein